MTLTQYKHCQPQLLLETVDGDQEVFLQLSTIFARESAEKFTLLAQAAAAGDFAQMGYQSHAIKGMVGQLGADALVDMLFDIEDECNRNACHCDAARLSMVGRELEQVRLEVTLFIAQFP